MTNTISRAELAEQLSQPPFFTAIHILPLTASRLSTKYWSTWCTLSFKANLPLPCTIFWRCSCKLSATRQTLCTYLKSNLMLVLPVMNADAVAKYQATQVDANLADTGMPCAGICRYPCSWHILTCLWNGNPLWCNIFKTLQPTCPKANLFLKSQWRSKGTYEYMNSKHKLGHANPTTGYYSYYKGLLPLAHKNICNAFWTMFILSFKMKISTTVQVPFPIRSMLFDLRPRPVFNASLVTQTVPYTFYQIVNTRLSLVWLVNATTLHVDLSWKL